jgi:hypothetical protein
MDTEHKFFDKSKEMIKELEKINKKEGYQGLKRE